MPTRRPLPPLNALRAFEATARNASFSKAAEELHVTPAALSHQIRGLEDLLGLKLFHRRARAIELTDAARLIYPGIRTGFESLRAAVEQLDRARQDRILVVSASPGSRRSGWCRASIAFWRCIPTSTRESPPAPPTRISPPMAWTSASA